MAANWRIPNESPPPWVHSEVIGMSKPFPDFTSISTGTPSFMAGAVDLEAGNAPANENVPAFTEAKSQALKYFDVTTQEIQDKLICTMLPHRMLATQQSELTARFSEKPDLYGPFWICVTAALAIFMGSHGYLWASDVLSATRYFSLYVAFTTLFSFCTLVPIGIRVLCMMNGVDPSILKLDYMACVYGYGLLPIVPMSLLCMVPSKFLQLVIVTAALSLSLSFMAINMLTDLAKLSRELRVMVALSLGGSQLLLFSLFPLYFFRV